MKVCSKRSINGNSRLELSETALSMCSVKYVLGGIHVIIPFTARAARNMEILYAWATACYCANL
jgi:hypothetical protein